MADYGYIKLWRNIQNWKWRKDLKMFSVWMTLLTSANYKDENGLKAGQVRISRDALAEEAGVSEKQVRTCIERLIKDGSLTKDSSRQGTVYTITNWKEYQCQNMDKSSDENGPEMGPTENEPETVENERLWQCEQEEKGQQPSKRANERANEILKKGQQKGQQEINVEALEYNNSAAVHEEKRANEKADEIQKKGQQKGPFLKNNKKNNKKDVSDMYVACIETVEQATTPTPPPSVMKALEDAGLKPTKAIENIVQGWVSEYGEERVLDAIKDAVEYDSRGGINIAYLRGVLEDHYHQKIFERIVALRNGRENACV